MKVVINKCYGGFSLSNTAIIKYLEKKGKMAHFYSQTKYLHREGQAEYTKVDPSKNIDKMIFVNVLTKDYGITIKGELSDENYFSSCSLDRTNPDLIKTVEEMGKKANGRHAELKIVEIPDGMEYTIEEYDGIEWIAEKHRTWG